MRSERRTPWTAHSGLFGPCQNSLLSGYRVEGELFRKDIGWVNKVVCIVNDGATESREGKDRKGQTEESGRPGRHHQE